MWTLLLIFAFGLFNSFRKVVYGKVVLWDQFYFLFARLLFRIASFLNHTATFLLIEIIDRLRTEHHRKRALTSEIFFLGSILFTFYLIDIMDA